MDKTGQYIENFGKKMAKMALRISRMGSAPIGLHTLVSTDLIDCKVLDFHPKDTCLNDLVDSDPKALSADYIILTLKTKFLSLEAQGLWSPSK